MPRRGPTTPASVETGLGSFPFARRYLGNRVFFLFLRLLRCFSSAGCPDAPILFSAPRRNIASAGLPHSEISGSLPACGSPKLFAVDRVLLRLLAPRHPPYALIILTSCFRNSVSVYNCYLPPSRAVVPCFSCFSFSMRFSKNGLVEMRGIEPLASCLQGRRSPI